MKLPGMPFRGGRNVLESAPPPAPKVDVAPRPSAFDAKRQAVRNLVDQAGAVAKVGGSEAGLGILRSAPPEPATAPEPIVSAVVPPGPERWSGNPRSPVDIAAINDMGVVSEQHGQEQALSGSANTNTANETTAAEPAVSAVAAKPEAVYVPVLPATTTPDLVFGRGAVVSGPNTSGATTAAIEAQIGPPIVQVKPDIEAQQPLQAPLPDAADLARRVAPLLTKDPESYMALDPKARAEYLSQALETYLENPSAIRLSDGDYARLTEKMIGKGEVSQDETLKYAIDSTLRLIADKGGSLNKQLFQALENHPELQMLIARVTDKMGLDIDVKENKAVMSASAAGKGLFLMILMLVLSISKEMVVSGFSDQRR